MNIEHQYLILLKDILDSGLEKEDRTGTGTISMFGRQIRHKMNQGFPLLTTKKMYWKGIVIELLWFLRGDTNIKYLVDNGCNIWNGDCYKKYCKIAGAMEEPDYDIHVDDPGQNCTRLMTQQEFIEQIKTNDEFARKWGDLGPVYGKQWVEWECPPMTPDEVDYPRTVNQIQNLIEQLKTNPDSRRLIVNAWNVGELDQMTLPPCHYGFQCYTTEMSFKERIEYWTSSIGKSPSYGKQFNDSDLDERNVPKRKLSLMWSQRSVDTFLGLPFNIASYGLLLEIIAKEVNMVPDELIGNLGDVHLYKNHIEQAKEQLTREPKRLPKVLINNGEVDNNGVPFTKSVLDGYDITDFELVDYQSHPSIKASLSN